MAERGAPSVPTVVAAAIGTFVFLVVLRTWMGAATALLDPRSTTDLLTLGILITGTLAVGPLSLVLHRFGPRSRVKVGFVILALGRAALLVVDHGLGVVLAGSVAVAGGTIALGGIAGGARDTSGARFGMLLGVTSSAAAHAALGTLDLTWRSDGWAQAISIAFVLALLVLPLIAERGITGADGLGGPAWPWATFGPVLLLVGAISSAPGRLAVATGWDGGTVTAAVIAAHAAAVVAALVGPRLAGAVGPAGAGLVLIGTAGALDVRGLVAGVGQLILPIGIGLVLAATTRTIGTSTSRRRAAVIGGSTVAFGAVAVATHARYILPMGFNNRGLLLAAALLHAGVGIAAGIQARRGQSTRATRPRVGASVVAVVAATALLVVLLPTSSVPSPAPGLAGQPIRAVVHDLSDGYRADGRFSIPDVVDLLRAEDPDLVMLSGVDRGWLLNGGHDTLRLVAEGLELPYVFAPSADEIHGNALLTRYPVSEFAVEPLPVGADVRARTKFRAVLDTGPDEQLGVVGAQLAGPEVHVDTRVLQARTVAGAAARLRERNLEVVVLGQLAAELDGPELATFGMLTSLRTGERTPTSPAAAPTRHAHQVLASAGLVVSRIDVPTQVVSRDRPLVFTLTRRAETP